VGAAGDASTAAAVRIAHQLAARDDGEVRTVAAELPLFPHVTRAIEDTIWKRASLIVVGMRPQRAIDRLFGHETAIAIARRASVPVLAVTRRCETLPERVLVGVDFTESSRRAGELAGQLIAESGEIVLAHIPPFAAFEGAGESWVSVYMTGAADRLEEERITLARLTRRRVRTILGKGEPGEQLLKLARKMCCDTIAVGAHAQGFVDRVLLGSIATRVLRAATCSVLVAPRWR